MNAERAPVPEAERQLAPLIMNPFGIRRPNQSGWFIERYFDDKDLESKNPNNRVRVFRSSVFSAVAPQMNTWMGRRMLDNVVDSMLHLTRREYEITAHGGSVTQKRLAGSVWNGPEILRTFTRIPNTVFTEAVPEPELPFYEGLANRVRRRLSIPNFDFKVPILDEQMVSVLQEKIAHRLELLLTKEGFGAVRSTGEDGSIYLRIPYDPDIFNPTHYVLGHNRTDDRDVYNHSRTVFPFKPATLPTHVVISVRQLPAPANPDWKTLQTRFSCLNADGQELDVVDMYAKRPPRTITDKTRDDRAGWVPSSQRLGEIWSRDGLVSLPSRTQLMQKPRMHPESFTRKNVGSLAVAWTRILRGEAVKDTFSSEPWETRGYNFPDGREETAADMRTAAQRMADLWRGGQRYKDDVGKRTELTTDQIVALHYNPTATFRSWRLCIPREEWPTVLPHAPIQYISSQATRVDRDGTGLTYHPWSDTTHIHSGLTQGLRKVEYQLKKTIAEWPQNYWHEPPIFAYPNLSPLAKAIWLGDLFAEK